MVGGLFLRIHRRLLWKDLDFDIYSQQTRKNPSKRLCHKSIAVFGRVFQVLILVHCPSLPSIVIDDRNTFNAYIYTVQDNNRMGPFFINSINSKAHLSFKMIAISMRWPLFKSVDSVQSAFSHNIRPVLIPASAIANNDVTIRN